MLDVVITSIVDSSQIQLNSGFRQGFPVTLRLLSFLFSHGLMP
jgi:hypothetical protein